MPWSQPIKTIRNRGSLRGLARWLLLGVLVAAPWLYGGTTAWSIELINDLLALVVLLWIASLLLDRRWPAVPRAVPVIAAIILVYGWWMALNAHAVYDSAFRFFVLSAPLISALPGSSDFVLSVAAMTRISLLLGIILFVAETARRPLWLARLWYAIAISGGALALLGLLQKATHAPMMFWQPADPAAHFTSTFFASFYYHANAGAFLNLVLPVSAGLLAWTTARRAHPLISGFYLATFVITIVAVLSNTSRMAQFVAGLIAVVLVVTMAKPIARIVGGSEKRNRIIGFVIIVIAALAIGQAARLDQPIGRWRQLSRQWAVDERWAANRTAFAAVGNAGLFGFGPGTFRAIFPHYQATQSNAARGTWRFLHDDYLQTILEWGFVGAAALGALFFGGIAFGTRNYFQAEGWSTRQRVLLPCMLLALIGVAIHAVVDFPLQILSIQLFAATYLGVCWGSGSWGRPEVRSKN